MSEDELFCFVCNSFANLALVPIFMSQLRFNMGLNNVLYVSLHLWCELGIINFAKHFQNFIDDTMI